MVKDGKITDVNIEPDNTGMSGKSSHRIHSLVIVEALY